MLFRFSSSLYPCRSHTLFFFSLRRPPTPTLFPYTTLFRSYSDVVVGAPPYDGGQADEGRAQVFHGSPSGPATTPAWRSEEHTSELQSQSNLVCRLLLEKKNKERRKKPRTS